MKSFRNYIKEEVLPTAQVSDGGMDIEKPAVRAAINAALAGVTSQPAVTPYVVYNRISKLLAQYHIILPKKFLEGDKGVEVFEVRQFGLKMGMTDSGEFVNQVPPTHYLFLQYGLLSPMGITYAKPVVGGMYRVTARLVDRLELDRLLDMAEITMSEEAECRQMSAKAMAPKEEMHDITSDEKKKGNKEAVVDSEKGLNEVSLGKLVRYKNKAGEGREKGVALADKKMKGKAKVNASMPKNAYMEETQIDEVSKELANRYRKKAHASYTYAAGKREDDRFHERGGKDMTDVSGKPKFKDRPESEKAKDEKTIGKRLKGLTMAHKRLKEEQIDEVSAGLASRAAHHAYAKSDKMKKDAQKEPDMHSYVQAFHKGEKKNKQGIKFAKYAANKMEEDKDPCWKGYEQYGMKKKGGRKVPNCVPVKEEKSFNEMTPSEKMQWMKDQVQKGKEEKKRLRKSLREKPKKNIKEEQIDEKAPPGAKFERMVKHIKKGYSKDGLTAKEKSIAYATAWKAKKRESKD